MLANLQFFNAQWKCMVLRSAMEPGRKWLKISNRPNSVKKYIDVILTYLNTV